MSDRKIEQDPRPGETYRTDVDGYRAFGEEEPEIGQWIELSHCPWVPYQYKGSLEGIGEFTHAVVHHQGGESRYMDSARWRHRDELKTWLASLRERSLPEGVPWPGYAVWRRNSRSLCLSKGGASLWVLYWHGEPGQTPADILETGTRDACLDLLKEELGDE